MHHQRQEMCDAKLAGVEAKVSGLECAWSQSECKSDTVHAQVLALQRGLAAAERRLERQAAEAQRDRNDVSAAVHALTSQCERAAEGHAAETAALRRELDGAQRQLSTLGFKKYGAGWGVGLGIKTRQEVASLRCKSDRAARHRADVDGRRFSSSTASRVTSTKTKTTTGHQCGNGNGGRSRIQFHANAESKLTNKPCTAGPPTENQGRLLKFSAGCLSNSIHSPSMCM
jgi:hypothetical protein